MTEDVEQPGAELIRGSELSVTVVIPAYNAEQFIRAAIRSVLDQKFVPLELIVVNDGSTDQTENVVREEIKAHRSGIITRLITTDNKGAGSALNTGFKAAIGKFVTFLAADDAYISDTHLMDQIKFMRNPRADISYWRDFYRGTSPDEDYVETVHPTWAWIRFLNPVFESSNLLMFFTLFFRNPINSSGLMFRKDSYLKYGQWNPETRNADCDRDLLFRYLLKGARCKVIPRPGPFYRVHPGQLSNDSEAMRKGGMDSRRRAVNLLLFNYDEMDEREKKQ